MPAGDPARAWDMARLAGMKLPAARLQLRRPRLMAEGLRLVTVGDVAGHGLESYGRPAPLLEGLR